MYLIQRRLLCQFSTVLRFSLKSPVCSAYINSRHVADLVVNHQMVLDPACKTLLDSGEVKHRKHPGRLEVKCVELPIKLQQAATNVLNKYRVDDVLKKSDHLTQYLWSRHPPASRETLQRHADHLEKQLLEQENVDIASLSGDEREKLRLKIKNKLTAALRKQTYKWEPVRYDAYRSILYLVGRFGFDYASAYRILSEIERRDPGFSPHSVFHYGSGVGSSIWSCNAVWSKQTAEHHCVDMSDEMNTLARLLLQEGKENASMLLPGVYFRRFLPSAFTNQSTLVISSFSLIELANREERLKVLHNLWNRTEQYLVIIENGTNAGYSLVMEARDFILKLGEFSRETDGERGEKEKQSCEETYSNMSAGHVFSPCPHDLTCPRQARDDGTPCNFEVNFYKLQQSVLKETKQTARFSYVVLKKGPRGDSIGNDSSSTWPRIVRPVTCASKCVHIRTCSPSGQLEYSAVTAAKHTKDLYWCARGSVWGDLLPVTYQQQQQIEHCEETQQHTEEMLQRKPQQHNEGLQHNRSPGQPTDIRQQHIEDLSTT